MILNNYWEMRRFQQLYRVEDSQTSISTTMREITNGTTINVWNGIGGAGGSVYAGLSQSFNLVADTSIVLGSSTELGDVTDYALKEPISSGFTISNLNWNITTQNGSKRIITFNVTASTDININEVGIVKSFPANYNRTVMQPVLLIRVVLGDTISLHSGESSSITIEWNEA